MLTTTQHFDTVNDIQSQVVDARVWLGFHFRNSVERARSSATTSPTGSSTGTSSPSITDRGSTAKRVARLRAGHSRSPRSDRDSR